MADQERGVHSISHLGKGGIALFTLSGMLWLYRHNLNPVNYIVLGLIVFRLVSVGVSKTSLFVKQENDRNAPSVSRWVKIHSSIVAVSIVFLLLSTAVFLMFSQQVGGNPGAYDSENYYEGSFHNLGGTYQAEGFLGTMAQYLIDDGSREPSSVLPTIEYAPMELNGNEVSITWFGHSSLLLQSSNLTLLIDPVFGEDNTDPLFLGPQPFEYEHTYELTELPKIDFVFISHDHYDHLDMGAVKHLTDSQFLVPLGVEAHLMEWGVASSNIQAFDWYQEANITDELRVVFTPSQHFSGRGLYQDNTLWGSWAIYLNQRALFFSGDGGYSDEFVEIGERYGPFEIAFIEAGQYDQAWADVHMFPDQSVQAAIDLKAATLLPIHNTKFILALHGWDEPLEKITLEGERRNQNVTTPRIGQSFLLDDAMPNDPWWRNVSVYEPPFLKHSPLVGAMMYSSMILAVAMIRSSSMKYAPRIELTYED